MSVVAEPLPPQRARDALIGARVDGRYRISGIHGRGGMSVVYAGVHEQQQREVAIKVLDESLASDPDAVKRFVHEARTASSISHGHVVGVSDFGRLPDGRPYLVMPMIAGTDMATLLANEGPIAPQRVAALLSGVGSALDSMHARGLVHRDIKSENLMHIRGDDGTETVLVLDFGIAAEGLGDGAYAEGDASGTPEFMAPEVLDGQLADPRSDIYSLGTVAFELMTGCLPFAGDELPELLRNKASGKQRTLAQVAGIAFPRALEAVLARALALEPGRRQRTCGELVRELRAAAAQMPNVRMKPSARIHRPARSRTLVGTGLAGAAAGGVTRRAGRSTNRAWQAAVKASEDSGAGTGPSPNLNPSPSPNPSPNLNPSPSPSPKLSPSPNLNPSPSPSPKLSPSPNVGLHPGPSAYRQGAGSLAVPAAVGDAAGFASLAVDDTLRPPPERDIAVADDEPDFRARGSTGRWLKYAGVAAAAVLALAIWSRAQPKPAPLASESTTAVDSPRAQAAAPTLPLAAPVAQPFASAGAAGSAAAQAARPEHAIPAVRHTSAPTRPAQPKPKPEVEAKPEVKPTPEVEAKPEPSPAPPRPAPAHDTARAASLTQKATDSMLAGHFAAARAQYQQAIEADPRHAPAHRGKGLLLERMGRRAEAADAFRRFLRLSPRSSGGDKIRARLEALEASP